MWWYSPRVCLCPPSGQVKRVEVPVQECPQAANFQLLVVDGGAFSSVGWLHVKVGLVGTAIFPSEGWYGYGPGTTCPRGDPRTSEL